MTNEETIKEISDALIAQGEVRNEEVKKSVKYLETMLSLYKQVRWLSWFNSLLCLGILLALLSCNREESPTDKYIRENNEEIAKSKAKMDSIDLELLKLGVKDGSTKGE